MCIWSREISTKLTSQRANAKVTHQPATPNRGKEREGKRGGVSSIAHQSTKQCLSGDAIGWQEFDFLRRLDGSTAALAALINCAVAQARRQDSGHSSTPALGKAAGLLPPDGLYSVEGLTSDSGATNAPIPRICSSLPRA